MLMALAWCARFAKKFPGAVVSRVPGADLWEALMERAGREGTPVFLIGGKPEILAQTEAKLRKAVERQYCWQPGWILQV